MRILFLDDFIPPRHIGGPGKRLFELAARLAELGHEVFIITSCQKESEIGEETKNGITIFSLYSKYPLYLKQYFGLCNPFVVGQIDKILSKIRPDIVHANIIYVHLSYASLKVAKKYSKAVFLHSRDAMLFHYGKFFPKERECEKINYKVSWLDNLKKAKKRFNPFYYFFVRRYLKYVDKVFAVSNELAKALKQNGIFNVSLLYNGLPIPSVEPEFQGFESKTIFLAGRLNEAKGVYALLDAFPLIKSSVPDAKVILAGASDDEKDRINKYLVEKQIKNADVEIFGWVQADKLKAILQSVSLVVSPSLYFDPFPGINLEAALDKKPVVATCFGGGKEFVLDGITGCVVNPYNKEELANKIIDILTNKEKARRFAEAAYQRLKKDFSLNKQVEKLLNCYNKTNFNVYL
jgi:glycogen(starch) synthase